MPMYEYKCGSCGHGFERYSAGVEKHPGDRKCPKCGKETLEKLFSTFASTCCGGASGGGATASSGGCGGGSSQFS